MPEEEKIKIGILEQSMKDLKNEMTEVKDAIKCLSVDMKDIWRNMESKSDKRHEQYNNRFARKEELKALDKKIDNVDNSTFFKNPVVQAVITAIVVTAALMLFNKML